MCTPSSGVRSSKGKGEGRRVKSRGDHFLTLEVQGESIKKRKKRDWRHFLKGQEEGVRLRSVREGNSWLPAPKGSYRGPGRRGRN